MPEPLESAAQQMPQVIDTGAESFSVDNIPAAESAPQELSKPAEELQEPKEKEVTSALEDGEVKKEPEGKQEDEEFSLGVQKKIGKLTRKRRDAERETQAEFKKREAVELEAKTLREENEALKQAAAESTKTLKPRIDDFESDEDFFEALTDWKMGIRDEKLAVETKKAVKEREEKDSEAAHTESSKKIKSALSKGAEKYSDFSEVIEDLEIPTATLPVFEHLENAGDVAYFLGNNPDTADMIASLDSARAGAELQKISNKLTTKKITNAPKPIKPLSTTGGTMKSLEDMSMAEYNKARDKQEKDRRGVL